MVTGVWCKLLALVRVDGHLGVPDSTASPETTLVGRGCVPLSFQKRNAWSQPCLIQKPVLQKAVDEVVGGLSKKRTLFVWTLKPRRCREARPTSALTIQLDPRTTERAAEADADREVVSREAES